MGMASHGISLGWWLLPCMGSPALTLCLKLVWEKPFPCSALPWQGVTWSTPKVSWSGQQGAMRQVQGDSGEEERSLSLPLAAEVSSLFTASSGSSPEPLFPSQGGMNPAAEKYLDIFLGMLTWPSQNLGIRCPEWAGA